MESVFSFFVNAYVGRLGRRGSYAQNWPTYDHG